MSCSGRWLRLARRALVFGGTFLAVGVVACTAADQAPDGVGGTPSSTGGSIGATSSIGGSFAGTASGGSLAGSAGSSGASHSGGSGGAPTAGGFSGQAGLGGVGGVGMGGQSAGGTSGSGGVGGMPPAGMVETVLAGGDLGKLVRSTNGGDSWQQVNKDASANGGEDGLIRSVAYGNGVWVAGGYPFWWTSPDAKAWTKHNDVGALVCLEAVVFFKGKFYAACGARVATSSDGQAWSAPGPRIGEIGSISVPNGGTDHCYLAAGIDAGTEKIAAFSVEAKISYSSTDATSWVKLGADYPSVSFCGGQLRPASACGGGVEGFGKLLRVRNGNIERAKGNNAWDVVYDQGGINSFGDHVVIAFGYSPP